MGQMTYGVMLGIRMREPKKLKPPVPRYDSVWHNLCDKFDAGGGPQPDTVHGDGHATFDGVGFWIAVGASGERGVPNLEGSIEVTAEAFRTEPSYAVRYAACLAAWPSFVAYAATRGVTLPAEPRLYLVETEVA